MILIVDNYDSFTYNLVHLIGKYRADIEVVRNDQELLNDFELSKYSHVIISPGPCSPAESAYSIKVIERCVKNGKPLLGVCLGMQALITVLGGDVVLAHEPVHGKVSKVNCKPEGIFLSLPEQISVVRYHSLMASAQNLPQELRVLAKTDDDVIMAVQHKSLPIFGVQFHPESVLSEYGDEIIKNFLQFSDVSTGF